jgi:hypothetical protein
MARRPKRRPAVNFRRTRRASLLLLALLLFRAYIPAGFMPASGVPFALELCPAAMADMPAGHLHHLAGAHDTGAHDDIPACPFGSASSAGPISHRLEFQSGTTILAGAIVAPDAPLFSLRPEHSHQPRGPPLLV